MDAVISGSRQNIAEWLSNAATEVEESGRCDLSVEGEEPTPSLTLHLTHEDSSGDEAPLPVRIIKFDTNL